MFEDEQGVRTKQGQQCTFKIEGRVRGLIEWIDLLFRIQFEQKNGILISYVDLHLGLFLVFTSLCVLKDQRKSPFPLMIIIYLRITFGVWRITGFVLRESVIFRVARARNCKVFDIGWGKIYDADSGAGINILERECERCALWGPESMSFERADGRKGASRNRGMRAMNLQFSD